MYLQIISVWDSKAILNSFAMVTSKKSPYYRGLKFQMVSLIESGIVRKKLDLALKRDPDCKPWQRNVPSLGFNKMFSLFIWIAGGCSLACIIFVLEKRFLPTKKPQIVNDKESLTKLQKMLTETLMEGDIDKIPLLQANQMLKEVDNAKTFLNTIVKLKSNQ